MNSRITLVPLRQEVFYFFHSFTFSTTVAGHSIRVLGGFGYFHLVWRPLPVKGCCLCLTNCFSLPFPPGWRPFGLLVTVFQGLDQLTQLKLSSDLTSSSSYERHLTCGNSGRIPEPFHRSKEGLYHFSPPRFNYYYLRDYSFTCSCWMVWLQVRWRRRLVALAAQNSHHSNFFECARWWDFA